MDINKIFSLFSNEGEEDNISNNLITFQKSPYFKLGMFKKLIIYGIDFKRQVVTFFSKADEDLDIQDIDLAGEFMMYNRGWFWISQFDWDDPEWVSDLEKIGDEELLIAIKLSIHYFEECEEFEKCAFLKKIQDTVQKYLAD